MVFSVCVFLTFERCVAGNGWTRAAGHAHFRIHATRHGCVPQDVWDMAFGRKTGWWSLKIRILGGALSET